MTGDDIIEQSRAAFGEREELTLLDSEFVSFLNEAKQELYDWLPITENTQSLDTATVSLTAGKGPIPEAWDKILEVTDGVPLTRIDQATMANIVNHGTYFEPETPVWYSDGENLYVRPIRSSVEVTHTAPPEAITNTSLEIEDIPRNFHPALVHLVTSLAYAQEEDIEQAAHYRSIAQQMVSARIPMEESA